MKAHVERIKSVLDWLPRRFDPVGFYYWKRPWWNVLILWMASHVCLHPAKWLLTMTVVISVWVARRCVLQVRRCSCILLHGHIAVFAFVVVLSCWLLSCWYGSMTCLLSPVGVKRLPLQSHMQFFWAVCVWVHLLHYMMSHHATYGILVLWPL